MSLRARLSTYWCAFQEYVFPIIEEEIGPLGERYQILRFRFSRRLRRRPLRPPLVNVNGGLRCFRGIDNLTALALVCEVGDFGASRLRRSSWGSWEWYRANVPLVYAVGREG